jgi:NADH-quinone oxidoreductase subunit C
MPDAGFLATLEAAFPGKIAESSILHGYVAVVLHRDDAPAVLTALHDNPAFAFNLLSDLTVVDLLGQELRFEIVYQLYSITFNRRLQVKIRVSEDDAWAYTVSSVWKAGNWLEREVWDMFGITFKGHPDMRRILMYEEFRGYPLRKDYPVAKRQPLVEERDPITNPWPKR